MSSRRRNRGTPIGNESLDGLQNNELPYPGADLDSMSTTDFSNLGYGSRLAEAGFESVGRGKVTAKPVEISRIFPDASQPRRTIPSTLRHYWNGRPDADSMANLFDRWLNEVAVERGKALDIDAYLSGAETDRALPEPDEDTLAQIYTPPGAKEAALLKVIELASSIMRDGLTNPITVVPRGNAHLIETGERRWLAYQLLAWRYPDDDQWVKIPARQVDDLNIWRQASENYARDDLNAIARARQLALLLMDVYAAQGVHFAQFDAFEQEQEFYAQVADGNQFKAPTEMMEAILNALGLENSVQIRQYRRLLRLPNPVWILADDLNWTQNLIDKRLLNGAPPDDIIMQRAARIANSQHYSVSDLTLDERNAVPVDEAKAERFSESQFTKMKKSLRNIRKSLHDLPRQHREELLRVMAEIVEEYR